MNVMSQRLNLKERKKHTVKPSSLQSVLHFTEIPFVTRDMTAALQMMPKRLNQFHEVAANKKSKIQDVQYFG